MPEWGSLRRIPQGILFWPGGIQCRIHGTFPQSTIWLQYFTFTKVQPNVRNVVPPMIFQVQCPWLRWIGPFVEVRIFNSAWSLENWINSSLTWHDGDGLKLHNFGICSQTQQDLDHFPSGSQEIDRRSVAEHISSFHFPQMEHCLA